MNTPEINNGLPSLFRESVHSAIKKKSVVPVRVNAKVHDHERTTNDQVEFKCDNDDYIVTSLNEFVMFAWTILMNPNFPTNLLINITKLDLSSEWDYAKNRRVPNIYDDDVQEFADRLHACTSLESLDVHGNQLSDASGDKILSSLASTTSLTDLGLSDNSFGPATGAAMGTMLSKNKSLRSLNLNCNNQLGEEGGAAIIRGLKCNTTLKFLYLRDTGLGEKFRVLRTTSSDQFEGAMMLSTRL